MPQFFFDIQRDGVKFHDDQGHEVATQDMAGAEAMRVLPAMAKDARPGGCDCALTASVRDENGKVFFTAVLSLTSTWVN